MEFALACPMSPHLPIRQWISPHYFRLPPAEDRSFLRNPLIQAFDLLSTWHSLANCYRLWCSEGLFTASKSRNTYNL